MSSVKPLVYLGAPYNHADAAIMAIRAAAATYAAAALKARGWLVFSPLTHNQPLLHTGLVGPGWAAWAEFDRRMLAACDRLVVLLMPGWEFSAGLAAERDEASRLGIKIAKLHPASVPGLLESLGSRHGVTTLPQRDEVPPCTGHCASCDGADHHWDYCCDLDGAALELWSDSGCMRCKHCGGSRAVDALDE